VVALDVTRLPEDHQRRVYDAFHVEVRYHPPAEEIYLRATIDGETAPVLGDLIGRIARELDIGASPVAPATVANISSAMRPGVCDVVRAPNGSREAIESAAEQHEWRQLVVQESMLLP
jgi:site-specific DNA recombinase